MGYNMDNIIVNLKKEIAASGGGGGGSVAADDVSYDNTTSGLTADNVQEAIDEIVASGPGGTVAADDVTYDNTTSGLTADDVQEAIDEINSSLPGLATTSAAGIVQPDGTSITVSDGVISADLPGLATTSAAGIVQPDGTTITVNDGVISAAGGSGGGVVPFSNVVFDSTNSVTGNSSTTYRDLLYQLYSKIDRTKITPASCLVIFNNSSVISVIMRFAEFDSRSNQAIHANGFLVSTGTNLNAEHVRLYDPASNCAAFKYAITSSGLTITDQSTNTTNDVNFGIIY